MPRMDGRETDGPADGVGADGETVKSVPIGRIGGKASR
jgi:hypothetical protein